MERDYKVAVIPIPTNMRYTIKMSATAQVRLVLVVKRDERPTLWDFYGGDSTSNKATLLDIDLTATRLRKFKRTNKATGIENVREDNGTTTVIITGTVRSKNDTTNLYIGLIPPLRDDFLCARCRARSKGPCGFCFATTKTSAAMKVNLTIGRYVADCLFWDRKREEWNNSGCEVSIGAYSFRYKSSEGSYIAQYPVLRTARSAFTLYFPGRLV